MSLQPIDETPGGMWGEMPRRLTSDRPAPVAIEFAAASDVAFADAVERSARVGSASLAAQSSPSPGDVGRRGIARIDAALDEATPIFFPASEPEPNTERPDVSVDLSPDPYLAGWDADEASSESPALRFESSTFAAAELEDSDFDSADLDDLDFEDEDSDRGQSGQHIEMGSGYAPPVAMPQRRHLWVLMTAAAMIAASAGVLVANLERSDPAWRDHNVGVLASRVAQQFETLVGGTRSSPAEPAVSPAASATTANLAGPPPAAVATSPETERDTRVRTVATPSLATPAEIAAVQRQRASYNTDPGESTPASSGAGLIAFEDERDGQPRGIYIDKQDGSGAVRVSGGGRAAAPTWSSD